ncbi:MAG: hypothetical protein ACE5JK_00270 [Candidatus Omnitrophota bacterium]
MIMKIEELIKLINSMSKKEKIKLGLLAAATVILMLILIANYKTGLRRMPLKEAARKKEFALEKVRALKEKRAKKEKPVEIQAMLREVGREDPFLPATEKYVPTRPARTELYLSGIVSDGKRSLAIINDMLVGEGDMIGDKKIIKIKARSVIIRDDGREYILKIGGFESQKGGK